MTPTAKELEGKYPLYFFRYTGFKPTRKHAVPRTVGTNSPGKYRSALCGVSPHWALSSGWQGSNSDEERTLNDQLEVCKRCNTKLSGDSFGQGLVDKSK